MNRYLDHMQGKPTHERRQHAVRVAGVITALVFAGWVTTLGLQLGANDTAQVASKDPSTSSGQAAAVFDSGYQANQSGNQLIVSTTTDY